MKDVCMYPILGVIFWQLKLKLKQFILSTNNSKGLPPFFHWVSQKVTFNGIRSLEKAIF